jgi:hypothetical protein
MADTVTANLAGANKLFNSLVSKFDTIKSDLLGGLETEASALASTLGGDLTAITGDLRSIMPSIPALPDINLQAGLTSLSGLVTGSDKHTALLNDITSNFGSELSAGGFSLDTLVSNATTAVGAGDTLSGIVPNFVKGADGLTDAFQIADAVKQATTNSIKETASTFTVSDALTSRISAVATNVEASLAAIT